MDPDHDQGRQDDDNIEHRIDPAVHRRARSIVGSTARTVGRLLLSGAQRFLEFRATCAEWWRRSNDEADVELTILCAHNLKNLSCFGSMNPRAELYINKPFTVNTVIDFNGGRNPHWNYTFWFKIDNASLQIRHLTIEIYDWSCLRRDRLVGTARIPMSDLSGSNSVTKFLSYQVQLPSSEHPQGVVNVLVRRARMAVVQRGTPLLRTSQGQDTRQAA